MSTEPKFTPDANGWMPIETRHTQTEVRSALLNAHAKAGSYAALAKEVCLSDEYVRQACLGKRPVTGKLLAYLGYIEEPRSYRKAQVQS